MTVVHIPDIVWVLLGLIAIIFIYVEVGNWRYTLKIRNSYERSLREMQARIQAEMKEGENHERRE